MKDILWKDNLSFIKDVTLIHLNFITVIITASEKNNGRPYCRTAPLMNKLTTINLTKLKQNSNETSITVPQRNCC
jgi:hypothetical protein